MRSKIEIGIHLAEHAAQEGDKRGLHIVEVEYLLNGEVVSTVGGDPLAIWRPEDRYPTRVTAMKSWVRARSSISSFNLSLSRAPSIT